MSCADITSITGTVRGIGTRCSAPGFLDSGLKVITSTLPRPARRNRVALGLDSDSRTSLASTARCTSVETRARPRRSSSIVSKLRTHKRFSFNDNLSGAAPTGPRRRTPTRPLRWTWRPVSCADITSITGTVRGPRIGTRRARRSWSTWNAQERRARRSWPDDPRTGARRTERLPLDPRTAGRSPRVRQRRPLRLPERVYRPRSAHRTPDL